MPPAPRTETVARHPSATRSTLPPSRQPASARPDTKPRVQPARRRAGTSAGAWHRGGPGCGLRLPCCHGWRSARRPGPVRRALSPPASRPRFGAARLCCPSPPTVEALCDAAGERSPIRLTTSTACAVPLALTGRQIVLPERFLQQLDAEHQRAALAHEIAHVVRRDPAWRILAGALERAFFFQPLNRVARAKLCESAEFLCDQWAVQQTRRPLALARCLSIVASWASPASDRVGGGASTMARSDSPLVRRVTRILNEPPRAARRPAVVWLALPLVAVAMAAPLVTAAQLSDPADAVRHLRDPGRDEHPS